ncbi:hypothetical protein FHS31_000224 [Sphingomonas vulcanisoli]|uniref:Cytochrome C biogenesis protein n=1 Tax=Sphingomonas vulcanisoli TaxID=1658060 RepID=A0ABX0TQH6_9SPHN|nr:cytochrome C biogenesis protein [Sphingomonas vulcanisoli]NIJ06642.1 hypothetical protein [Sphingomonas vulcanisoli]
MIGWLIFLVLAIALLGLLAWRVRLDRGLLMLAAAAVAVAAAGYSWQGRPGLGGHPGEALQDRKPGETAFADERHDWMDSVGPEAQVLDTADAFIRNGDPDYAVGVLRGAIAQAPRSPMLWIGLGNALVHYADGQVTPAAYFAFERAAQLWPGHPAPPYFLGLAEVLSGNVDAGMTRWRRLLMEAPQDAPWRSVVAERLMLVQSLRNNDGKIGP